MEDDVVADFAPINTGADSTTSPVVEPVSTPLDDTPSDVAVFSPSSDTPATAEKAIEQQIAEENGATQNNLGNDGRAAITAAGQKAKAEKAKEEKEKFEHHASEAAAQKKFAEETHDFAGMAMSGNDINKLIHFYANNPQMMDKLQERMVKTGRSPHDAKQAVEAFKEYMKLIEKESKGVKLTEEEQRRKVELSKREEVREVAREARRFTDEYGVKIVAEMAQKQAQVSVLSADQKVEKTEVKVEATVAQAESAKREESSEEDDTIAVADIEEPTKTASASVIRPVAFVESSARENFPNAPAMMKNFALSSAMPVNDPVKVAALESSVGLDDDGGLAIQASIQINMPLAMGARA